MILTDDDDEEDDDDEDEQNLCGTNKSEEPTAKKPRT
jgi:hypothetical protein